MTKSKKAEFRPNEFVVYPAHGVGRIISIEEQEIAGLTLELFVISFEKDKMTLRVPTHKATEIGMRQLSSPDVVTKALDTLKGKAKVKRAMWSRRAQEYEQKINSGDLLSIAEVVRDLHRTDDQREQSYSERQLYEAALERLTREVAAVSGVDEAGAAKTVDNVLVSRAHNSLGYLLRRAQNVAGLAADLGPGHKPQCQARKTHPKGCADRQRSQGEKAAGKAHGAGQGGNAAAGAPDAVRQACPPGIGQGCHYHRHRNP